MPYGVQLVGEDAVAFGHHRQHALLVLERLVGIVGPLDVCPQEPREQDRATGCREHRLTVVGARHDQAHMHRLPAGVGHLRCDGALPDQFVEAELGAVQLAGDLVGCAEHIARGPDRLVSLLSVLRLARIAAGSVGQVVVAVLLTDLGPRRVERRVGQRDGVGPHVGDEAVLVQPLCCRHRLGGRHAQLPAGLLLQGRRHERRGGTSGVRLGLDGTDAQWPFCHALSNGLGRVAVQQQDSRCCRRVRHAAVLTEVLAGRQALTVELDERRGELRLVLVGVGVAQLRLQVPPRGCHERHAFTLSLHDDPGRDRLDPARGQPRHDLLPQDGADLVAVETIEDAPGLLGVHEPAIQLTGVLDRMLYRRGCDLVEDHPLHGNTGVEHLEQMPRDRLALAILICRQVELVGVLQQGLEATDLVLLVGADHVQRLEVVLGVHTQPCPRLALVLLGHVGGVARQVPDVTDGRLDLVAVPQETGDGARLGRRLDDDEGTAH